MLVDALLRNIGEDLHRFSFVDFGSGKGRVLLVASHYPFREVVGVEFSPELQKIAEGNIRSTKAPNGAVRMSARFARTPPRSRFRNTIPYSTSTTRSRSRSSLVC
jgi:predicted RNA methylase